MILEISELLIVLELLRADFLQVIHMQSEAEVSSRPLFLMMGL